MIKLIFNSARKFFLFRVYKYYLIVSIIIIKNSGIKELIRKRGWMFLLIIIFYYAVRDFILYIIIPFLIVEGFI